MNEARADQSIDTNKMLHPDVVLMTSVHPVFDTRIFHKMAVSLVNSGRSVTLVAPHDKDERVNGVDVVAVTKRRGRVSRFLLTSWQVARKAYATGAPVCHFHDPELMPAGLLLKLSGRKVVFDVHEDLPQQIGTKTWIPKVLRVPIARVSALAEWVTARCVDRIVAATSTIAKRFPQHKAAVVQNYPILGELETDTGSQSRDTNSRRRTVCYIGGVGKVRGAVEMVQALEHLDDVRMLLAGPFETAATEAEVRAMTGWENVNYCGVVDRQGVREILAQSRVGLVVLHPEPNYIVSQPIKMFEYMSAGLPVVASDFTLWREIIADAGAGLLVDPLDPKAIAAAIEWVFSHEDEAKAMGQRGQKAVQEIYNWQKEEAKLLEMYDELDGPILHR